MDFAYTGHAMLNGKKKKNLSLRRAALEDLAEDHESTEDTIHQEHKEHLPEPN